MNYGMGVKWRIGDRAKWLGRPSIPMGVTSNPPSPGWVPPTDDRRSMWRDLHVVIVDAVPRERGFGILPVKVRADDGTEFDPSVDIDRLVSADHDGWRHPDLRYGR